MFFNSIKKRIIGCLAAWVVVLSATHFLIISAVGEAYTLSFYIVPPLVSIIPFTLLASYMYFRVIRPLDGLSGGLKGVVQGLHPGIVEVSSDAEMGVIVRDINTLLHALHQRDVLLRGMNERLQEQNKELMAVNERLVDADRLKTQFLAGVTHELKTPLSTIRGYSEMMLNDVGGELNPAHRDFTLEVVSSSIHLTEMINDILDYSKAQAGTLDIRFGSFSIPALVDDAEKAVHPLLARKGHTFEKSLLPGMEDVVADRTRIKQVMMNLLSNAAKFTPNGGRIRVEMFESEGIWGVSVTDNGIGIKEDDFSRMFLPFSQLDSSYTRDYEGTGLGLAICKKIIEMHGGRIWADSKPGKGSSFCFTIPDNLKEAGVTG